MIKPLRYPGLLAALLLALTAAVYTPGLGGDFIFDDYPNIVTNPKVQPQVIDFESLRHAAMAYEPGHYGRPLATITFAVDYLIGGKNPLSFKISSLIMHLLNVVLMFALVRKLLGLAAPHGGPNSLASAFAITALWAIHPLQISTVLYVVQRMETLSLTFVLLGLLMYIHGRQQQVRDQQGWGWIAGSVLVAGIGLLSKETAVLFPAYTLALELTLLRFAAAQAATQKVLRYGYAVAVVLALVAFLFVLLPHYMDPAAFAFRNFSLGERLLTQLRVLPLYLAQIVAPSPQLMPFYYDNFPVSTGLLAPLSTLFCALGLAALLGSAFALRKRLPLYAFGILLFFASHAITSNILPLELVFEHRNYFALLGILLALAAVVHLIPVRDGPAIKRLGIAVVIAGFGVLAAVRAGTWGDPLLLATDLVARNPESARASNDIATLYAGMAGNNPSSPFFSFAMAEFERGMKLPGSSPLPEHALILMAASADKPADNAWWDSLIRKLQTNPPGTQELLALKGLISQRSETLVLDDDRLAAACAALDTRNALPARVLAMCGDHAINYGNRPETAAHYFQRAVALSEDDPQFVKRMSSALESDGHSDLANRLLPRDASTTLRPGSSDAQRQ